MPWEETDDYIRSEHENPDKYDKDSMRIINITGSKGIKAIIGCPKGYFKDGKCEIGTEVQSYLFAKSKSWNMIEAKGWFEKNSKKTKRGKRRTS